MKSGLSGFALYLYINNLTSTVHSVGGIDPMGTELGSISGVGRQLRRFKLIGSTPLARALFRLFTFWLAHGEKVSM